MKNLFASLAVIMVFTFVSCKEKQPDIDNTLQMPPAAESVVPGSDSLVTLTSEQILPQQVPATPTARLNPEHGQPGHRCDIQVGAPLDAPAAAAPVMSAPVASPVLNTPVTAPLPASGKLNPPHGQPGHDCSVAVGAPLS